MGARIGENHLIVAFDQQNTFRPETSSGAVLKMWLSFNTVL